MKGIYKKGDDNVETNKRTLKWATNREYISDQQLLAKLYMKARDKNIELVATLKVPSLLIIGVEITSWHLLFM